MCSRVDIALWRNNLFYSCHPPCSICHCLVFVYIGKLTLRLQIHSKVIFKKSKRRKAFKVSEYLVYMFSNCTVFTTKQFKGTEGKLHTKVFKGSSFSF